MLLPRLANAPVSYGVFGHVIADNGISPRELLRTMAEAGYEGSELGPPEFFGTIDETVDAFRSANVCAAGAYIPLHLVGPDEVLENDLARMDVTVTELLAVGSTGPAILADEGSETLLHHPVHPRRYALDDSGWNRTAGIIQQAADRIREAGVQVSFHPHISTYVEQPWEVERLLDLTDVDLTYDVGHIVFAGGDARAHAEMWWERINHIHVKDGHLAVLNQAVSSGRTDFDDWWAVLCSQLGQGDVDLRSFLKLVVERDYRGWIVVEQDRRPTEVHEYPDVARQQRENRNWLVQQLSSQEDCPPTKE
jgi:inosose dehydratase